RRIRTGAGHAGALVRVPVLLRRPGRHGRGDVEEPAGAQARGGGAELPAHDADGVRHSRGYCGYDPRGHLVPFPVRRSGVVRAHRDRGTGDAGRQRLQVPVHAPPGALSRESPRWPDRWTCRVVGWWLTTEHGGERFRLWSYVPREAGRGSRVISLTILGNQ